MSGPVDPESSSIVGPTGQALGVNPDGSLDAASVDGAKTTYIYVSSNITVPASATDIFALQGSSTKTVRIIEVRVSGTQTTAGPVTVVLLRRTGPNSGGTFTTTPYGSADTSDNLVSTAITYQYSANPTTLGVTANGGGFLRITKLFVPSAATVTYTPDQVWQFGWCSKAIVLRGANQWLCVNLNAQTVTGGVFVVNLTWTEE